MHCPLKSGVKRALKARIERFQLDPNKKIELLEVGQRQTMALILAMFRRPLQTIYIYILYMLYTDYI